MCIASLLSAPQSEAFRDAVRESGKTLQDWWWCGDVNEFGIAG